jgi:predicted nucleic acid-binding protein
MIALDTTAVICVVEGNEPARSTIVPKLSATRQTLVSAIAVAEVLVGPLRDGDRDLLDAYDVFFAGQELRVVPATEEICRAAATIRSKLGLKLPDAIQLATAITHGCTEFVTTDTHFARCVGQVPLTLSIIDRLPDTTGPGGPPTS